MRRPLLLNGFMATGKSTVGRLVQSKTGHPFVDLDARIEQRAGASVAEIFRQHGEAEFRELERAELAAVRDGWRAGDAPPVVALGGGALLHRDTRLACLERAVVVTLEASAAEIARRVNAPGDRPLLGSGDVAERARELLETRRAAYCEAHARIATDGSSTETVAEQVIAIWKRDPVAVAAGERSYSIDVGTCLAEARLRDLVRDASAIQWVSDRNVFSLHGARVTGWLADMRTQMIELTPGEESKNLASLEQIYRACFDNHIDRKAVVIGFGGGVVTDVAGFAAATWLRGVRWIALPTTLLAMVDAAVGGKTAVDFLTAKNAVGAFWQPSGVVCDVDFLATEPTRGYASALAEVVKTALIGDATLFELLESQAGQIQRRDPEIVAQLVERSVRVKAAIVSRDAHESGLRAVLNLGHTVGHALEACAGYGRLTHGEAVSLGLVAALRIGSQLDLTPPSLADRAIALLAKLGLPVDLSKQPLEQAAQLIGHDKKRAGSTLRFVIARGVGQVELVSLPLEQVSALAARAG
jgi:shikimate kinase/3-dehydroquinate synthase